LCLQEMAPTKQNNSRPALPRPANEKAPPSVVLSHWLVSMNSTCPKGRFDICDQQIYAEPDSHSYEN